MGRQPCCDKNEVKKGPWSSEEDKKLTNFILNNGQCCWRSLPKLAGFFLSHYSSYTHDRTDSVVIRNLIVSRNLKNY